mmetsp:Transcript_47975/g.104289  ORF Transcript_47975/g.104289 Transcript_47975/m.104289 type:complete len:306 (-) Transcript_47975:48-965(-)|eukprot:CAMPEP_0204261496 /NCGR_PEP_ID=MMETSP0468-20130131/7042_1 /ASSEMBLY_ACC=CAM_ASM_000383 /TAXON_ID=2969 /ORGANISM="Oxyrrhis marina" /LENGTH=305 /DNA_ID=CAMNT_0051236051 /DNA_START=26 /DNA_END=943 /DNA_ORIENTATION=+
MMVLRCSAVLVAAAAGGSTSGPGPVAIAPRSCRSETCSAGWMLDADEDDVIPMRDATVGVETPEPRRGKRLYREAWAHAAARPARLPLTPHGKQIQRSVWAHSEAKPAARKGDLGPESVQQAQEELVHLTPGIITDLLRSAVTSMVAGEANKDKAALQVAVARASEASVYEDLHPEVEMEIRAEVLARKVVTYSRSMLKTIETTPKVGPLSLEKISKQVTALDQSLGYTRDLLKSSVRKLQTAQRLWADSKDSARVLALESQKEAREAKDQYDLLVAQGHRNIPRTPQQALDAADVLMREAAKLL